MEQIKEKTSTYNLQSNKVVVEVGLLTQFFIARNSPSVSLMVLSGGGVIRWLTNKSREGLHTHTLSSVQVNVELDPQSIPYLPL